jgi:molecular chaperone DnaK (HSP70)
MSKSDWKPVLGIDLGTSTCLACVIKDGHPEFIKPDRSYYPRDHSESLRDASNFMPSAFAWVDGKAHTGKRASDYLGDSDHAGDVVLEIKRHMQADGLRRWPSGDRDFSPTEIAGHYVQVLRRAAEYQLDLPDGSITRAVVTVPASFGSREVKATKEACAEGGLIEDQVTTIDEPVAAAYSLQLHRKPGAQLVLVVDLGGGTFDVTLLRLGLEAGPSGFEELGRDGEQYLGGLDWDREIARSAAWSSALGKDQSASERINRILEPRSSKDPQQDRAFTIAHNLLFREARKAKEVFYDQFYSSGQFAPEFLERLDVNFTVKTGGRPYSATIAAEDHIENARGLVNNCIAVCDRMFSDVSKYSKIAVEWADLNEIYLAGGGSRMATIRHAFTRTWREARRKRSPKALDPQVRLAPDPQGAVAEGAAWCGEDIRLGIDLTHVRKKRYSREVGLRSTRPDGSKGFKSLVARHTVIPFAKPQEQTFKPWIPAEGWDGRIDVEIVEVENRIEPNSAPKYVPFDPLTLMGPSSGDPISEKVVVSATATVDGILKLNIRWGESRGDLSIDPNAARRPTADPAHSNGHAT